MNDKTPGEPGFLPGTVWTRVDEVGVGDRVFVRQDDDDLWALVTSIEPADVSEVLRLELTLEPDGAPGGRCEFTLKKRDVCMRKLLCVGRRRYGQCAPSSAEPRDP